MFRLRINIEIFIQLLTDQRVVGLEKTYNLKPLIYTENTRLVDGRLKISSCDDDQLSCMVRYSVVTWIQSRGAIASD